MFLKQAARGKNEFIYYILTILLVAVAYFVGQLPLLFVILQQKATGKISDDSFNQFLSTQDFSFLGMNNNTLLLLLLVMFVISMGALYLGAKAIHKKKFTDIITSRRQIDWGRVFFGFGLWFGATVILEFIIYFTNPDAYVFRFEATQFIPLLLIAILIIPIQTSFEEIAFRGYLMQGIGLLFKNRFLPIIITSILFGMMHMMNPEVGEYGMSTMMVYYIGIGLFLAILTVMDEGLELALGVHAATNIYSSVCVTFEGSALQTDALFKTLDLNVNLMIMLSLAMAALFLLICHKKYNWGNWNKLFSNIDFSQKDEILPNEYERT